MATNELKQLVAKHFDYATPGTGQILHGDWFTPKHKDSLHDLLDAVTSDQEHELMEARKETESAEEEVKDLKSKLEAVEEALAA